MPYSDYLPAGTTRTAKRGIERHVPYLPDYFNHQWFEDFITDFLTANILENNGVISGCVISQDGGNDAFNITDGVIFVGGNKVEFTAPATYEFTTDGFKVVYITSAGSMIVGEMDNASVQGAVTPNDAVIVGYAIRGGGSFYIIAFSNNVSLLATAIEKSETQGADYILGTQAQVTAGTANVYYDDSTSLFRDKDDLEVTFVDGEKIKWIGIDALTGPIDLSAIDYIDWDGIPGNTISLGSQNLQLGIGHRGELDLSGTGTISASDSDGLRLKVSGGLIVNNSGGDVIVNNVYRQPSADFESKDLKINVASGSTVACSFKSLSLLDSEYNTEWLFNKSYVFDTASHLESGTSLKINTHYWLWADKQENLRLVPDLVGVADADVLNSLSASAMTFLTDLVNPDDEIYQTDDGLKGYVKAVSAEGLLTCKDEDGDDYDMFPNGNEGFFIRKLSPEGLGSFKSRVGAAYRNAGGNFDNSFYTQIQEEKEYFGDTDGSLDFTITSANGGTAVVYASIRVSQVNDKYGIGRWRTELNITYDCSSVTATSDELTVTGHSWVENQKIDSTINSTSVPTYQGFTKSGNILRTNHASATISRYYISGAVMNTNKPTYHI